MIPYPVSFTMDTKDIAYLNLARRDWTFKARTIAEGRFDRYTQDFKVKIELVVDLDI
jgi:hypothetical protein